MSDQQDHAAATSSATKPDTASRTFLLDSLKGQAATWFVGLVISILAIFSAKVTEYVKVAANSADFRSQYYNELAVSLSAFDFDAELVVEYLDKGWTEAEAMTPLLDEYNASITDLRKKEYVYLSWIGRYWGKPKMSELSATYGAIRTIDADFHSLNDEFGAVNIRKTQAKVDPDKARQALVVLVPALKRLQENSRALLTDLQ